MGGAVWRFDELVVMRLLDSQADTKNSHLAQDLGVCTVCLGVQGAGLRCSLTTRVSPNDVC